MNIVVLTPVRLLGDGLAACLNGRVEMQVVAAVTDLATLRETLDQLEVHVVLVDVTQGVDLSNIRALASECPDTVLVALGLNEEAQEVINCARAGFRGYVGRAASIDSLAAALSEIVVGRLACTPEIAGGLFRALFRSEPAAESPEVAYALTRRESEVLGLLGRGLTNKEIAGALSLSVPTVKHHVHHVLQKLKLTRRSQAMHQARSAPWTLRPPSLDDGT